MGVTEGGRHANEARPQCPLLQTEVIHSRNFITVQLLPRDNLLLASGLRACDRGTEVGAVMCSQSYVQHPANPFNQP